MRQLGQLMGPEIVPLEGGNKSTNDSRTGDFVSLRLIAIVAQTDFDRRKPKYICEMIAALEIAQGRMIQSQGSIQIQLNNLVAARAPKIRLPP